MIGPIEIEKFDAQFEGIHIYVNKLWILLIEDFDLTYFPEISPFTSVHHQLEVSGFPAQKDLIGDLTIVFRSQGRDEGFTLSVDIGIRARSNGPSPTAETFCKTVQFVFDWAEKWAKENDIRDKFNEPFVMPRFLYSKAHFEAGFPQ